MRAMTTAMAATIGLGLAVLPGSAQEPSTTGASVAVPTLDASSFRRWFDYIRPNADEQRWRAIPWRPTVWAALVEAQSLDRPILVWAMNGHPMACT